MSKVHVFGGGGFVGRALTPLMQQAGVACNAPSSATLNLTDAACVHAIAGQVQEGDSIVMLSALTPEKGDAAELTAKNIAMVQHVLAGVKDRPLAQFIYLSSDAVYPLHADAVDERTAPSPYDLYGQMHMTREHYLRRAIPAESLTILRPCAIYGVGDTHNSYGINRFIRTALGQGEITLFGGGEEYRDHVHVDDVAGVILSSLQRRLPGTFNIASGGARRFCDIAEMIQAQAGREVKIIRKPRAQPITHRHFNVTLLQQTFPHARPRSIAQGVAEFLKRAAVAA